MNVMNSKILNQFYQFALAKSKDTDLSKEDTVIHMQRSGDLSARKWVCLGFRSDEFKDQNAETRKTFFDSVVELFGGDEKNIPETVLEEFKLKDYLLENGQVTSRRPLTARRIISVCERIMNLNQADTVYSGIPGFSRLSADDQEEYRHLVFTRAKERGTTVSDEAGAHSVQRFLTDKYERLFNALVGTDFQKPLANAFNAEAANMTVENLLAVLEHFQKADFSDRAILELVRERTKNRPAKEECLLFLQFNKAYAAKVEEWLKSLVSGKSGDGANCPLPEEFAGTFDFGSPIDEETLAKRLSPDEAYRYMAANVDRFKTEFSAASGRINEKFRQRDQIVQSKYGNIMQTLEDVKSLRKNEILQTLIRKSAEEARFMKTFLNAGIEAYRNENGEFSFADRQAVNNLFSFLQNYVKEHLSDGDVENYRKIDSNAKDKDAVAERVKEYCGEALKRQNALAKTKKGIAFPATLTSYGRSAIGELEKCLKMTAHGDTNSAAQIEAMVDALCGLDELFFRCLDFDKANPDKPSKFDALMATLNESGCLQYRADPVLNFIYELDNEVDLKADPVTKADTLERGFGKVLQTMDLTKDQDYEETVDKYLAELAKTDEGAFEVKFERGGKSVVPTRELLLSEEVKSTLTSTYPYFG